MYFYDFMHALSSSYCIPHIVDENSLISYIHYSSKNQPFINIFTHQNETGQIAVFFWLTGRSKNRNSPSQKITTSQENTSLFQSNPNSVNQLDLVRIPSINSIADL